MVLMVEQNRGEHLIRRFTGKGNEPDPRDMKIASPKQQIQELEFPQRIDAGYDTDTEYVIEEEEGFVGKGRFGGKEDNIEDVIVVANNLCSSMIQTILSVDFEEDINTKSHELMSFRKSIIIKFYWPKMERDVNRLLERCRTCHIAKTHSSDAGLYTLLSIPVALLEDVSLDFVLGLPRVGSMIIHTNLNNEVQNQDAGK
ncbi:reverse transcriptase domain-containing protein [Tanacetum coccineum]